MSDRRGPLPYKVADNIKHPRVDEETIGFERALSGTMRLSLTGVWRDNKNFVNSVAQSRAWTALSLATDVGKYPDVLSMGQPGDSNTDYLIRNVDGFPYRARTATLSAWLVRSGGIARSWPS